MSTLPLFDAPESLRRRDQGMDRAAQNRAKILRLSRWLAKRHALEHGTVTADDVMRKLDVLGHTPDQLGNAAGSLFRGSEWECVGWVRSERVSNNGRMIRRWRRR